MTISSMKRAKALLEKVKGQSLSDQELQTAAIDLAEIMLMASQNRQTRTQRRQQEELAKMIAEPKGKHFLVSLTDQSFRSHRSGRVANQIVYLLKKFGIPQFLSASKRLGMQLFKTLAPIAPLLFVPMLKRMLRREASRVILPGEESALKAHIKKRIQEGIRVNLNHLGEAVLGEEQAQERLASYLNDLKQPEIDYISVKISNLYSQINLLAWNETLSVLKERLKKLFRAAPHKFVNLDMEEYRDLRLTVDLFKSVLDELEFLRVSAGIVLQSYLPDSFAIQEELTEWAQKRVAAGGAHIKIRIVKGANLAMERVEASMKNWNLSTFSNKTQSDANFKKMVRYGMEKSRTECVKLGIASHNVFDIALALILRSQKGLEDSVEFEMLEGMAEPMQAVVKELSGQMLLYCPAAAVEEFQYAMAYLIRRLDENTAPENFLHDMFVLSPGNAAWKKQSEAFRIAFQAQNQIPANPQRHQNRLEKPVKPEAEMVFKNEADTDWSLPNNRLWADQIREEFSKKNFADVPLVFKGHKFPFSDSNSAVGYDPSRPNQTLYRYALATERHAEEAIQSAKEVFPVWSQTSVETRMELLATVAQLFREHRGELIGVMLADGGKIISEADTEVSEAIDFIEYYRHSLGELSHFKDIGWNSRGTLLVASPWNFPCAIPAGGIAAALAAGNCVIFKPAPESVLVGYTVAKLFWEAGISAQVLQFVPCEDAPVGSSLVVSKDISGVILTGATATAKHFLKLKVGLNLFAETGGKNTLIVTSLADRDLAIKDLIQSAFSHSGQKCSACSLAILEDEVYDDPNFRGSLRDAVASLSVGSVWEPQTIINPLIRPPSHALIHALTTLEPGEEWLLEPKQDPHNPNIWSPGIKLGVTYRSFTYSNELFGPVLGLMRAGNLKEAITLANGTLYGLTAGLHSLDDREKRIWLDKIIAGNCYINRTMTGAIVQRQPFGGTKESSFGPGAKAGGPNYVMQLFNPEQLTLPHEQAPIPESLKALVRYAEKSLNAEEFLVWEASTGSYVYYWGAYFSKSHDPGEILGQDNLFAYVPLETLTLYVQAEDTKLEILQCISAAQTVGIPLRLYGEYYAIRRFEGLLGVERQTGTPGGVINEISRGNIHRLRLLRELPEATMKALADLGVCTPIAKPLANGRLELLKYLREVSVSSNYHRYGNIET